MKIKVFAAYDPDNRMIRLGRIMWNRGIVGDGNGYSCKLSLAVWPRLFDWQTEHGKWFLTVLGLRIALHKSYGGIYT